MDMGIGRADHNPDREEAADRWACERAKARYPTFLRWKRQWPEEYQRMLARRQAAKRRVEEMMAERFPWARKRLETARKCDT